MDEYERIIEEARDLRRSVVVAQRLRASFVRYASIHAIITAALVVAFILGFYFFYIQDAPDTREEAIIHNTARTNRVLRQLAQENHEVLVTIRCLLLTPPEERTLKVYQACATRAKTDDPPERGGTNNPSNDGGGEDPAPEPPREKEDPPEPRETKKPPRKDPPLVCLTNPLTGERTCA